uniref:CRAL-TRIO domain-containing protein n=1 Tax=viral metagenome TaxID=1070528 RepID=A0A6C0LUZ7_9ZZZZ
MLILTDKLWLDNHIIKVHSSTSEDWKKVESRILTTCVLEQIKSHLTEVKENGSKRMVLIIDLSKGCFPPWFEALRIAHYSHTNMKKLIVEALDFTIIYVTTPNQETWINRLLSLYSPARPVHIVHTKKEIKEIIMKNEKN